MSNSGCRSSSSDSTTTGELRRSSTPPSSSLSHALPHAHPPIASVPSLIVATMQAVVAATFLFVAGDCHRASPSLPRHRDSLRLLSTLLPFTFTAVSPNIAVHAGDTSLPHHPLRPSCTLCQQPPRRLAVTSTNLATSSPCARHVTCHLSYLHNPS